MNKMTYQGFIAHSLKYNKRTAASPGCASNVMQSILSSIFNFLIALIYVTATRDPGTILPVPAFELPSP